MKTLKKHPVGEVRPSQLLLSYGVGALMDLPHISALIMGLDDWDITNAREISEERLLSAVQRALGGQVARLYMPPIPPISPAPRSERMSPNMFSVTSTSSSHGRRTMKRAMAST